MEVGRVVAALLVTASLIGAVGLEHSHVTRGDDVRRVIAANVDSLGRSIDALGAALALPQSGRSTAVDADRVSATFRAARARYKRVEPVVEFYAPALAAAFNSRRAELDDDDAPPPSASAPTGFPALEELIASAPTVSRDSAQRVIGEMRLLVARLRALPAAITPTDAQVIELTRLELVRVSTLGITDFDTPRTGDAIRESAEAIDGVRATYAAAGDRWPRLRDARRTLDSTLDAEAKYLRAHSDFVSFDRFTFLVAYGEPAARALDGLRRAVHTTPIQMRRALRADVASAYASNAFDPRSYAPISAPPSSAPLVALGKQLFSEPALAGNGARSCASCHDPERAFADGRTRAASIDRRAGTVARNTPALINAALQPAQLADERAVTLEDQVISVLHSRAEMGSSVEAAARAIARESGYRQAFALAFNDVPAQSITPVRLRQALAAYVRTLIGLDSRFDRAVRGDPAALTDEERRGFNLFMGKARCGTCHFAPLFGGSAPPLYVGSDVEVIGTPASAGSLAVPDRDSGRAGVDRRPEHYRAFKVPSLRNVSLTAPYMHNGVFTTLEQVVRFYDGGGGRGAGARLDNQTLAADSLHLSASEQKAIVAFLGSLTDTSRLSGGRTMR